MYLGAASWTFSWGPPYDTAIKRISALGFKSVELTIWGENFLNEYYTPATCRELATLIRDQGLRLSEVFSIPVGIATPDPKARAQSVEYFKRILDAARLLGTDTVIALAPTPFDLDFPFIMNRPTSQEWTVDLPTNLDWRQNWKDMIEVLAKFAKECESRSMRVALEPHPHRMMHNSAGMARILDQIDSPAIGLNLDPSHLLPMGEIPQVVAYEIGDRVFHTHLSDNDGQSNAHWRPGKGKVDWNAFLRALKAVGYTGALSIELEDVPGAAGYPGFHRSPDSTDDIDKQYHMAKEFLTRVCEQEGIALEK
ncbi:MAG: sugar phosphate isomerase/epimerase [Anaerolineae bacterium]|nr:sugar phosphate isomerase/epimerase [Anaerolineae bacterium]